MKKNTIIFLFAISLLINAVHTPSVFSQQKKTTVAILEFQSTGTLDKSEVFTLTNRFRSFLVKSKAFQVLEREKMNEVLQEQNFIISDNCNTNECAVQVGQLLGVEAMIAGDIGKIGNTFTIDLRMIDVQSGLVTQSQSKNFIGQAESLLNLMQTMAYDFSDVSERSNTVTTAKIYGPSYAIFSLAVPGLGGYFVDHNKARSVLTTVSALGLIGYGLNQKSKSDQYFSDYKKTVDQDQIKSLYKKANNAHHTYIVTTRIGAAIWIADIVWVVYKGIQNKKQSDNVTSSENGMRFNYVNNQYQFGYTLAF
jgi:TolB-like protein